jgi:hypothetical protein
MRATGKTADSSDSGSSRRDLEKIDLDFHSYDDPFSLRTGYVSTEELARISKRKNGRKLETYQRKQNKVGKIDSEFETLLTKLLFCFDSLLKMF